MGLFGILPDLGKRRKRGFISKEGDLSESKGKGEVCVSVCLLSGPANVGMGVVSSLPPRPSVMLPRCGSTR